MIRKIKSKIRNNFQTYLSQTLNHLPNHGSVTLVDIGAAGSIEPRWKPYTKHINYIGFEPDKRSREALLNKKNDFIDYKIYPYALSKKNEVRTLNLCKTPTVSSLYNPNEKFIDRFPNSNRFMVVGTEKMSCIKIDEVDIEMADFLKIDIQGGELDVIKGGQKTIKNTFGLEIEVEFINLYSNQPLFGDICNELSANGFEFFDFVNLIRWGRSSYNSHGQCVFGDALFLRSPESININNLGLKRTGAYLAILTIYSRFDLIEKTYELMDQNLKKEFDLFFKRIKKVKSRNALVRRFSAFAGRFVKLVGDNYKIHLLE